MSSFLISDKGMGAVLQGIAYVKKEHGPYPSFPESLKESPEMLWDKLFRLNAEAVSQRYEESPAACGPMPEEYRPDGWDGTPSIVIMKMPPTKIDAYKALRCLLYQCSEGDVYKRPFFKDVERCADLLARQIVAESPSYNSSEYWG